jgi:acetolactate synthase regulatory subunit
MTWKFHVYATEQRRLFSRILQVLESQIVSIRSFAGEANSDGVHITFVVSSEEDRSYRIEALLHRLEDVCGVSVHDTEGENISNTA